MSDPCEAILRREERRLRCRKGEVGAEAFPKIGGKPTCSTCCLHNRVCCRCGYAFLEEDGWREMPQEKIRASFIAGARAPLRRHIQVNGVARDLCACGYPTGETDADDRCIACGSAMFSKLAELNRRAKTATDEIVDRIRLRALAGVPLFLEPHRHSLAIVPRIT